MEMYSILGVQPRSKSQCTSTGDNHNNTLALQRVFNLWGGNADMAIVMSPSELLCPVNKNSLKPDIHM